MCISWLCWAWRKSSRMYQLIIMSQVHQSADSRIMHHNTACNIIVYDSLQVAGIHISLTQTCKDVLYS